jgi:hypothetical protein
LAVGSAGAQAAVTPAAAVAAAGEEVPQRPGSSLGRHSASDLLHQALTHHQRELGVLLNGSGGSAGGNPAGQQQQQQPAQLSSFAEQFLQQQQQKQSRVGTPLWQAGQPQGSFGGMQQHRRSDGVDHAHWDGLRCVACYSYCWCCYYMVQDLPEHPAGSQRGSWSVSVIIRIRLHALAAICVMSQPNNIAAVFWGALTDNA